MVLPNLALAVPAHYLPKPTTSNLNSKVDPTPPATPQPIVNHVSHGELTFLRPAEVDQTADLLTAFDGGLFDDAINLKGEVTYEIAVTRTGAIVAIELVSYADDGLKIDEILRPWLRAQQYTPAKKNGVAVNSIASFDLILGRLDRGKIMPPRSSVNISPPRQDERGNPLANSNNSSVFNRTIRPASPP